MPLPPNGSYALRATHLNSTRLATTEPQTPNQEHCMLSLFDSSANANRRDFLRIGTLGLGGLTLSQLLGIRAEAASTGPSPTERSVIFVFQHGGPSQFETYDPKMTAPAEIRCQTGEIATSLPG